MKTKSRGPNATKAAGTSGGRPRLFRFGPGTIIALLIAAAALIVRASGTQANTSANAGRITYQADSQGHLQPVDAGRGTPIAAPVRPLWKPEVSLLLLDGYGLYLSSAQKTSIHKLDDAWRRDKADLEASMRNASTGAAVMMEHPTNDRGAPLQLIQRGLSDYSAISREYDTRRADYWLRGYGLLNKEQRAKVDRLAGGPQQGRSK